VLFCDVYLCFAELPANRSSKEIVFYNVGEEDDIHSAQKKITDRNCSCIKGKSTSLDIVSLNIKNTKLLEKIKRILEMDNNLREWGANTKPESMKIDILHCRSYTASAFYYWDYFFSSLNGKLLSITVYVKDFKDVREQLILKQGQCIESDYCLNNGNKLILIKDNDKFFIVMFFESNIDNHFAIIEKKQRKKRELQKESIKEAF
jgi:hypothetical protein